MMSAKIDDISQSPWSFPLVQCSSNEEERIRPDVGRLSKFKQDSKTNIIHLSVN